MICPNCGNEIADGSVFCPNCGNKIENAVTEAANEAVKAAEPVVEEVKTEAAETVEEVKAEAAEAVEEVKAEAAETVEEVKAEAAPVVETVQEAAPVVEPVAQPAPAVEPAPTVEQTPVVEPTAQTFSYDTTYAMGDAPVEEPKKKGNGLGVAALIFGILSVVCCPLAGLFALIGLILAIISFVKKPAKKGLTIAGLILSILGMIIGLVVGIIAIVNAGAIAAAIGASSAGGGYDDYGYDYDDYDYDDYNYDDIDFDNFEDYFVEPVEPATTDDTDDYSYDDDTDDYDYDDDTDDTYDPYASGYTNVESNNVIMHVDDYWYHYDRGENGTDGWAVFLNDAGDELELPAYVIDTSYYGSTPQEAYEAICANFFLDEGSEKISQDDTLTTYFWDEDWQYGIIEGISPYGEFTNITICINEDEQTAVILMCRPYGSGQDGFNREGLVDFMDYIEFK